MKIRAEMLDEGLELLQKTLRGEPLDHEGTYYRAKGQAFTSVKAEIPIWLGASWPSRKPMRRAARFDGVMALSRDYRQPLSPDDVRDMSRFIADHRVTDRPFNVGVALTASDHASADVGRAHEYAKAGADWWQEGVFPAAESLEKLRTIVRRGPPKG